METKETKTKKLVPVSESALLALVAAKLKDKVLFPKKVEDAKKYLENVRLSS